MSKALLLQSARPGLGYGSGHAVDLFSDEEEDDDDDDDDDAWHAYDRPFRCIRGSMGMLLALHGMQC